MFRVVLSVCLFLSVAFAQQKVAILNTEDDGEPPIKHSELGTLTAKLRYIATETLPAGYEIMTEQSIMSFLGSKKEMERVCNEAEGCLAQIGRDVQAEYIGQARISRFGKFFSVKVEVYDVLRGTLVSSFTDESSKDIYALLSVIEKKSPDMFKKIAAKLVQPVAPTSVVEPVEATATAPAPVVEPVEATATVPTSVTEPAKVVETVEASQLPAVESGGDSGSGGSSDDGEKGFFTLGFRTGFNFSHLYAEEDYGSGTYNYVPGFQVGMTFDFALGEVFHIQPGIMYIQKGAEDNRSYYIYNNSIRYDYTVTSHYIEFPVLISLKLSALRLNAGPYFSACVDSKDFISDGDVGMNMGFGFDIGWFYIDMFYDLGLTNIYRDYYGSYYNSKELYNSTLGFNIGVNL